MPAYRTLHVVGVLGARPGLQRVRLDDGSRAFALTQVTGLVEVGDQVVVNTTAVDLGLGTGGWHIVHWNLSHRDLHAPGPGHIMKVRYTSSQLDTGAAEELDEEATDPTTRGLPDLAGTPVLVGTVHSQFAVAALVAHTLRPDLRITYVMTDGGALPIVLSDLVAALADHGVVAGTITTGHAFGGDLEAVSVASALQLAVEVQAADLVICAMGPGVVGTGTRLGTTAVEAAGILTTAAMLRARPVLMLRASDADPRPRHRGISHHSTTVLDLTPVGVDVPHPIGLEAPHDASRASPHRWVAVEPPDVAAVLDDGRWNVTTMGRDHRADPLFFRTVASAARHAVEPEATEGTVCAE